MSDVTAMIFCSMENPSICDSVGNIPLLTIVYAQMQVANKKKFDSSPLNSLSVYRPILYAERK